jgi:glycosyltransferase involved in cell wall biosynthesis
MKIAIFTQHYFPENFRINYLVDQLKKKNKIFIFTSRPHYNLSKAVIKKYKNKKLFKTKKDNLEIFRFPVWFQKKTYFSKILNYISYIVIVSCYLILKKKKKIDVIFVYATSPIFQCIPAILYKFITKKPLIFWIQDLWPQVLEDLKIPFSNLISTCIKPIIKWIYDASDLILCQSSSFQKEISKLTKKKTLLFENPSDVIKKKITHNSNKGDFSILFAGNLGDAQDLDVIVKLGQIIKRNKDKIIINILGYGKKFQYLKNIIKEKKLSNYINLKGYIPVNKIFKYYEQSSSLLISLVPGSGVSKTIPAKFQSYLAYGRPILACSDGEISKIVKINKLGFACASGDVFKLYHNIKLLKNMNIKEYKILSYNCFNMYRKKYLMTNKSNELINIFKDCIKNNI